MLLADELNARGLSAITRDERVRAFEQLHLPVAASLSRATVIKVGQIVGASEVIAGSFRLKRRRADRRGAQHPDGRRAAAAARLRARAAQGLLRASIERLAQRLSMRSARAPRRRRRQPPPGAFESYIKGLLAESAATQATFLETAVARIPGVRSGPPRALGRALRAGRSCGGARRREAGGRGLAVRRPRAAARRHLAAGDRRTTRRRPPRSPGWSIPKVLQTTTPPPAHLAPVLNNLGIVQLRRGASADAGSATYYLTRAADADPEAADYQFNLGYAYLLDRNHKAALYWLREAVRRDVTDADAHYLLALALQAEGSGVEAAREKDLARQLSSRYEERGSGRSRSAGRARRARTAPHRSRSVRQTVRTTQAISNSAQRGQRELATFHLDRGRQLFEQEQDREAMLELQAGDLSLAVRSGRAPADRPDSPARRPRRRTRSRR